MTEAVREQIDYPLLALSYPGDDPDCILELICDVLSSSSPGIFSENCFIRTRQTASRPWAG